VPPQLRLGINTCFAAKRWPEPERWVDLVVDHLGLRLCQVSLDLVDPGFGERATGAYADAVCRAARSAGLELHSTFTGLAGYAGSQLLHPMREMREEASRWFGRAIDLSARMGARGTGGFVGAFSAADALDPARRSSLLAELADRLNQLGERAARHGLDFLLMENMAAHREVGHRIEEAHELERLTEGSEVPWRLCLDLGHPAALSTGTASDDPIAWLGERWRATPVIQLQQANRDGDHHWPFTPERNAIGLVDAAAVVDALGRWGDGVVDLFLEIVHPAEADDEGVLADLGASVRHWADALAHLPGMSPKEHE
jgi:D-erythrulose 1-phosphate 3-epimerase